MAVPEGAELDPTGQWWWDGNEWQPVEGEAEFDWTDFQPELVMEWEELEDHEFIPDQSSGQVRFNPDCVWNDNAPGNKISCTFTVKNETPGPVDKVLVKSTVNDKAGMESPATPKLAAGATAKGTLWWPWKPPKMVIVLQIHFNGGPHGGKETHTVRES